MKNNILSSLLVSSFIVTSGFTLSASAEDQDMSSSTVIVDDVTIEIRVNKSTIQTLQIPELTEDHMAGAFLPGAFEPTAAGEVEATNEVTRGVNDDAILYTDKSEADELNTKRRQGQDAATAASKPEFVTRPDGNVTSKAELSVTAR
ncbi:MAG: hypothetical protein H7A01_12560 [Hahellaceae bacterium]|nr:hypothetical protein [Hahellaceae bacterium]MCP5209850.1 hypothetical protein [Hahellaceae bacterium]